MEIEEAKNALNGQMEEDVRNIVLEISSHILKLAGLGEDLEENKKRVIENIQNGLAYKKFVELIEKQHGDKNYLENIPKAKYIIPVKAEKSGYVKT
ncbi:MAG: pyrimidine-nucleoside phosphorylase, partial [Clostridia bacterium]|nr:pyrimidine-nucleoside phosphorylase [Clostridia bacterium]